MRFYLSIYNLHKTHKKSIAVLGPNKAYMDIISKELKLINI